MHKKINYQKKYQYLVLRAFWVLQLPLLILTHTSQHCLKEVHCHSLVLPTEDVKVFTHLQTVFGQKYGVQIIERCHDLVI